MNMKVASRSASGIPRRLTSRNPKIIFSNTFQHLESCLFSVLTRCYPDGIIILPCKKATMLTIDT
jgi:hypothetical protein